LHEPVGHESPSARRRAPPAAERGVGRSQAGCAAPAVRRVSDHGHSIANEGIERKTIIAELPRQPTIHELLMIESAASAIVEARR
jgi:hypothetical protein